VAASADKSHKLIRAAGPANLTIDNVDFVTLFSQLDERSLLQGIGFWTKVRSISPKVGFGFAERPRLTS
jgi:hypothetical protein